MVYIIFRVVLPRHSWDLYGELSFSQWGSCGWTKDPLVHSLHLKIHHRVNINGIPINARSDLCLADL